jgi:hypothetical protein
MTVGATCKENVRSHLQTGKSALLQDHVIRGGVIQSWEIEEGDEDK